MAHAHAPTLQHDKLQIGGVAPRLGIPALVIGAVALFVAAWKGFASPEMATHFFHSYLAAFAFFLALTLGALIFVLIQHAARAGWSVTVRRIAEGVSMNIFLMVLLLLPLCIPITNHGVQEVGIQRLFHWMHPGVVENDEILSKKSGYMNPIFFAVRMGLCFGLWMFFAWYFSSRSAKQDRTGDPRISKRLDLAAAPSILLMGFSLTAFAFDWIMGLNPHWFSTIFGVYYFAGGMLSALSFIVLISLSLKKRGLLGNAVSHEHLHDLGKLMFAFTFFWGYVAFAQYMLIWYANLPEETQFYIPRQFGSWTAVSLFLLIVHLLIPFPGLLSRHVKRKNSVLAFWAIWSLCACMVDLFWLVIPNQWINQIPALVGNARMPVSNALPLVADPRNMYQVTGPTPEIATELNRLIEYPLQPAPLAITILCFIGIGGLYLFSTMMALRGKSLVPTKDPRLNEALAFENV